MKKNLVFALLSSKSFAYLLASVLFLWVLYVSRHPIMLAIGNYLIVGQTPEKADAIYILSGGPDTRGKEGAKLYFTGFANKIFCTGENKHEFLQLFNIDLNEAEMTAQALKIQGVPDSVIFILPFGTSTREEAALIASHCKHQGFKKVIIVSDKFHTRRMRYVLKKHFKNHDTQMLIVGAPSLSYNENRWWAKENGLIMVNNEYLKLLYYWYKY